jgi:Phosphodiester glycosidase
MYRDDHLTNVGHAHAPGHVNNARWASAYKSALGFGTKAAALPAAAMLDLDGPGAQERLASYATVVQNLRLIRAPGKNVWGKQERRWSEAAVAADGAGRVLFIFCRRPHSMQELNDRLLALPLGIVTAMHVEGGPEASLSIHAGGVSLDLGASGEGGSAAAAHRGRCGTLSGFCSDGSYETGFNENEDEKTQWPIPNVLGVAARP